MEKVSIYELPNWEIQIQYTDELDWRKCSRSIVAEIENCSMDIIRNWELTRARQLAINILNDVQM